jgi:isopentenyl-diphosphate delta-isomerase
VIEAGQRRLAEEMGVIATLKDIGWFKYNANFANGLSEHEIDHVLIGEVAADSVVRPNPEEVHAYTWVSVEDLEQGIRTNPDKFTQWLKEALEKAKKSF